MGPTSLEASSSVLPSAISTRRSLWSEPDQSRDRESGAQVIADLSQSTSLNRLGSWPSSSAIHTSSRPERSDTNAIHFPLGDQRGSCSRQDVSVTRCTSPRSVAIVKISPCVETAARLVEGERLKLSAS